VNEPNGTQEKSKVFLFFFHAPAKIKIFFSVLEMGFEGLLSSS
jgi:hypothetical protein